MLAEERARLHPLPHAAVHGRVRHHPAGELGRHRLGRGGALLGAPPAGRHPGLGPLPRRRPHGHRRPASSGPARGRPPRPLHPGQPVDPRRALPATTAAARRRRTHPAGDAAPRRPSSSRSARARRPGWSRPPRPGRAGSGRKMAEAVALAKLHPPGAGRPAPSGPPRSPAGSPRTTCCASWPTKPAATSASPPTRASETHSLQPGTSAWSGFGITRPPEPAPDPAGLDPRPGEPLVSASGRPAISRRRSGGDPLAEAIELTRRLKLPHIRRPCVELVPTAKAQRWDPAELVRVLLAEEAAGRDAGEPAHPPRPRRVPRRQDLRRLGRDRLLHPPARPRTP